MPHKTFGGKGNVPSYVNTFKINQQLMDIAKIDPNRVDTRQKIDKEQTKVIALEKFKSSNIAKENIKQAKNMTVQQWMNSVKDSGKWNYKSIDPLLEHVGNFNYGATGAAMLDSYGRSRNDVQSILDLGAQNYSLWTNHASDDPVDTYFIKEGINYYYANVKK